MPFTLVHPAAVLPLTRLSTPLVPAALVVGAMAPDLPYYVPLTWIDGDLNLTLTHETSSLLWLDPLIGLVLLAGFQLVLRRPLTSLLPDRAAARTPPDHGYARSDAGWLVISLVLGSATHLVWDALCDAFGSGWSTRLNLASDVVGGVVLLAWAVHRWRTTEPRPVPPGRVPASSSRTGIVGLIVTLTVLWGVVRAVVVARGVSRDLREYGVWSRSEVANYALREFAVQAAVALAVTVAVYAVAWHVMMRRRVP